MLTKATHSSSQLNCHLKAGECLPQPGVGACGNATVHTVSGVQIYFSNSGSKLQWLKEKLPIWIKLTSATRQGVLHNRASFHPNCNGLTTQHAHLDSKNIKPPHFSHLTLGVPTWLYVFRRISRFNPAKYQPVLDLNLRNSPSLAQMQNAHSCAVLLTAPDSTNSVVHACFCGN